MKRESRAKSNVLKHVADAGLFQKCRIATIILIMLITQLTMLIAAFTGTAMARQHVDASLQQSGVLPVAVDLPFTHADHILTVIGFEEQDTIAAWADEPLMVVRSTSGGGNWDDASTWDAGRVPVRTDSVIITSGTLVTLSGNSQREAGILVIEADAELRGLVNARLAVYRNLINEGSLTHIFDQDQFFVGVLGRVENHGRIRTLEHEANVQLIEMELYGNAVNRGEWRGYVEVFGDAPRTVDFRGAECFLIVRAPEMRLIRDNWLPQLVGFSEVNRIVVATGARVRAWFNTIYLESMGFLVNRGEIIREVNDRDISGFGLSVSASDFVEARIISYGKQIPATFALANSRWFRFEPAGETGNAVFEQLTIEFTMDELGGNLPEMLQIFHSADGGATWEMITTDATITRNLFLLDVLGFGSVSMNNPPGFGDYVLATADPYAMRPAIGYYMVTNREIRVGGPPHEALLTYFNPGLTPLYEGLLDLNTGGGVYIERIIPLDDTYREIPEGIMEIEDFAYERDSTRALLITPELGPREYRRVRLILQAIPLDDEPPGETISAVPAFTTAAFVVSLGIGYLKDVMTNGLEEVVADPCFNSSPMQDKMKTAFDKTADKYSPFGNSELPYLGVASSAADGLLEERQNFKLVKDGMGKVNIVMDLWDVGTSVASGFDRYEQNYGRSVFQKIDCDPKPDPPSFPRPSTPGGTWEFEPVRSWDPNQKVGPAGAGTGEFISEAAGFSYRIDFENLAEATAPAWRVVIVDTLSSVFDPESVTRLGESHSGFSFTRNGNILRWEVTGIELPPNITPPEGEGWVAFSVEALPGLESGTVFENRATITFDLNPAIITNIHVNILDNLPPVTEMVPLPEVVVTDTLLISFNTDDGFNGSGVDNVVVFGSRNGGGYTQVAVSKANQARIPVASGSWNFYALSTDVVGNAEIVQPAVVTTTVVTPVSIEEGRDLPFVWELGANYPNPFNPVTVIPYSLQSGGEVTIRLYDVLGRSVMSVSPGYLDAGRHLQELDLRRLASGTYFYELQVRLAGSVLYRNTGKMMLLK